MTAGLLHITQSPDVITSGFFLCLMYNPQIRSRNIAEQSERRAFAMLIVRRSTSNAKELFMSNDQNNDQKNKQSAGTQDQQKTAQQTGQQQKQTGQQASPDDKKKPDNDADKSGGNDKGR
jgi:hypothetical protein